MHQHCDDAKEETIRVVRLAQHSQIQFMKIWQATLPTVLDVRALICAGHRFITRRLGRHDDEQQVACMLCQRPRLSHFQFGYESSQSNS